MSLLQILQNEYISIIAGGLGGIANAWLTQRVLNKRGIFSYTVTHNRVGITAEDAIFGNVAVSWNGKPVQNLYLSTIEMKNESMNDYENVVISAFTSDSRLMTATIRGQLRILFSHNHLSHGHQFITLKKQFKSDPFGCWPARSRLLALRWASSFGDIS